MLLKGEKRRWSVGPAASVWEDKHLLGKESWRPGGQVSALKASVLFERSSPGLERGERCQEAVPTSFSFGNSV